MRARVLATVASCALAAAPLAAQQLSIAPIIGTLNPLRATVFDTTGGGSFKMNDFRMVGMRLSKQMSPALALQLQVGAGVGGLEVVSSGTPMEVDATIYTVDLRASLRLLGNDDASFRGIVGAGWTQYGSAIFEPAHELDPDLGLAGVATGIIGFGVRARIGERVALVSDLTDRIHQQPIESPNIDDLVTPVQHDIAFNVGLSFPLGN